MEQLEDKFYTRSEFCKLYDFSSQQLDYHIKKNSVDTFEKDGKKYILNNSKNKEFGELNKVNKKYKSKYR